MNKFKLFILLLLLAQHCHAQDYNFYGSMTEEQLQLHLTRSISMNGLVNDRFEPSGEMNWSAYWVEINMLSTSNARFIGRACGFWDKEGMINQGYFSAVNSMVNDINTAYMGAGLVKPIVQACILENVTSDVNNIVIPQYVQTEYGQAYNPTRKFALNNIVRVDNGSPTSKPDISKIETQMWFYYLATQFLNAGIEAIHLGNFQEMGQNDPNKINWSNWAGRIRQYASSRNRGLVLLDGHTWGEYVNNTSLLLHDFHSGPQRITGWGNPWPWVAGKPIGGPAIIEDNSCSWYTHMYGGDTYFGWSTPVLPFLMEIDNYGGIDNASQVASGTAGGCYNAWGFDEIEWFSVQSAQYREQWLAYSWFKTKCLNPKGIFQMPGRRNTVTYNSSGNITGYSLYRAINGYSGDQTVIKNIWDGLYNGGEKWVPHNFTKEKVYNSYSTVQSNLVFASPDKMYYIADGGTIHGYVRVGGQWSTVSPSWAAQTYAPNPTPIGNQVLARGGLATSPDGSTLIYIGTDGYIHGFNIANVWDYEYFDFPLNTAMQQQGLHAINDLIFPMNHRIYYTANENSGVRSMHAFIKQGSTWITTSPTYSAQGLYGQPLSSQARPRGSFCGLTYDFNNDFLYYIGEDGYIHLFKAMNDWDYLYKGDAAKPQMITQNLTVMSKNLAVAGNKVYYLAQESNGNRTVHAVVNLVAGSSWATVSPSYGCGVPVSSQVPAKSMGDIAVSPDGNTIVFSAANDQLGYFKDLGSSNYSLNGFYGGGRYEYNSLQMPTNNEIYFTGNYSNKGVSNEVHMYQLEPAATCDNDWVHLTDIFKQRPENNDSISLDSIAKTTFEAISINFKKDVKTIVSKNGEFVSVPQDYNSLNISSRNKHTDYIKIYPNPASKVIFIEPVLNKENISFTAVLRSPIGYKVKQVEINNMIINSIDVSDLPMGIYILTIYDNQGTLIKNEKMQIN